MIKKLIVGLVIKILRFYNVSVAINLKITGSLSPICKSCFLYDNDFVYCNVTDMNNNPVEIPDMSNIDYKYETEK